MQSVMGLARVKLTHWFSRDAPQDIKGMSRGLLVAKLLIIFYPSLSHTVE